MVWSPATSMLLAGGLAAASLMAASAPLPAGDAVPASSSAAFKLTSPRVATVCSILGLHFGGGHKDSVVLPASDVPESSPNPAHAHVDALDLSKLDRVQLLQLLRDAMEENDRLRAQVADANRRAEEAEKKLEDRRIQVEDSESLAEAALRLAGIFVDAQHAIDLYGYNVEQNKLGGGSPSQSVAAPRQSTPGAPAKP